MEKQFLHEKEFIRVGVVRKSYGYRGDVKLGVDDIFEEDVLASEFLFLDIDGFRVPFRVVDRDAPRDLVVRFKDVDDTDETANVINRDIFLLVEDIEYAKDELKEMNQRHVLIGYRIHDQTSNSNFLIADLQEFPQQIMAVVDNQGKELLIPLNDEFIEHINEEEQVVHMNLPEGLLDL